ncbi:MAG: 1-deoxy-D-xylulose-5-phosphate synthase [Bacilli bacterium]|nr:1-deoxy-D-xylulose-5-phosphate synthase [Bacilli bacterium]
MLLDDINSPSDLKGLSIEQLKLLADEIRMFLVENVQATGGHFGPNLGVVELTLALHKSFNSPDDKLIWDVGHQAYVHKILTGRKDRFPSLRKYKGLAGFPKRTESEHDMFGVGHASTSISAAVGYAVARDLQKQNHHVVAVIGDGAMTGGIAFEAMNHVGHMSTNVIVVLNDNEMSISPNVGAMNHYLGKLRTIPTYRNAKAELASILHRVPAIGDKMAKALERVKDSFKYLMVPGVLFEELGFTYLGPIDGHNLPALLEIMAQAKQTTGPVMVHVVTKKGKGYADAEEAPDKLHAVSPPVKAVDPNLPQAAKIPDYSSVFGDTMVKLAEQNPQLVAVTAAMEPGSKLGKFHALFPDRFFDVGIAEQHAVTFCAGLACAGLRPVFAVYSTFLQRAYDQVIHDVCIQNLPVLFAIDRAGLVGADGETHQGVFDVSYLRAIPNLSILMPKDENELQHMLYTATTMDGPCAVRYPRAEGRGVPLDTEFKLIPFGKAEVLREGSDKIAILALGPTAVHMAELAADELQEDRINVTVINMRFVKPLDEELLLELAGRGFRIVTIEECALAGGMASAILETYAQRGINDVILSPIAIPDRFIEHGSQQQLLDALEINPDRIVQEVKQLLPKRRELA